MVFDFLVSFDLEVNLHLIFVAFISFFFLVVVVGVFGLLTEIFSRLGLVVFRVLIKFCSSFIRFISSSIFCFYLSVYLVFNCIWGSFVIFAKVGGMKCISTSLPASSKVIF